MEHNIKSKILIVDDEPTGRKTLRALLVDQGFELSFANDGTEALTRAVELRPDVILLDVMMPDMDGFEVCRQLRANQQLAEIAVIMVTALDDQDSRVRGIEAGADDFVSKPFDRAELRARVRTITSLNRYRRLHAERTRFEWVIEHTDDGYLIVDEHDHILYANPQARIQLHLPTDHNVDSESFLNVAKRHYQGEPQEAWDTWPNPVTGNVPRYLVQPASLTSDALWLQVDLLEQTEVEGARLVRLRNVTASFEEQRLMWAFHGQLSHKLKTPLALLDGFLSFLAADVDELSTEDRNYFISKARASASQLRQQIMSIFHYLDSHDVAKLRLGQCTTDEIPAIIQNFAVSSRPALLNLTNTITGQSIVPLSAQVIELILEELFQNAQKFHPQQSPKVEITLSETSHQLRIQVADDGQTLSADQLARLWTPYYQAERGFSGQLPGMGLGLSTVASFVWNVGGTCRAYNRAAGPGIVVDLLIPLIKEGPLSRRRRVLSNKRDHMQEISVNVWNTPAPS